MSPASCPSRDDSIAHWIDWMSTWHPVGIDLGLDRVRQAYQHTVFYTQREMIPAIIVGGTNGKGSVTAYLSTILQAAGLRAGVYRSPHLCRYNERFLVDNKMVDDTALTTAFAEVVAAAQCAEVTLSSFEIMTLAALNIFAAESVDVVILEVGLGGRLDAVNIVDPVVSVVTNIGRDHIEWLGNDREIIGWEKAHIFRPLRPAIIGDREIPDSVISYATSLGSVCYRLDKEFQLRSLVDYGADTQRYDFLLRLPDALDTSPLMQWTSLPAPGIPGAYQQDNAACALAAIATLPAALAHRVDRASVSQGLRSACLPGRLQTLSANGRRWLVDVSHNAEAAEALADHLSDRSTPPGGQRYPVIFGVMADKDIAAIVRAMAGVVAEWHVVDLPLARAATAHALAMQVQDIIPEAIVHTHSSMADAIATNSAELTGRPGQTTATRAERQVDDNNEHDIDVVIFGSFHTVAEAMPILDTQHDQWDNADRL